MQASDSIETRQSWVVALAAFTIIMVSFATPYIIIVGMKPIADDMGGLRSTPALAASLAYLGTASGGIAMGWWADRAGVIGPVLLGAVMVGLGAMLASTGSVWALYVGYGLMVGLLGNSGIFAPLLTYVSRWFDRRRGVAISLVTSGQQIAGAAWPPLFGFAIGAFGWQRTMFWFGVLALAVLVPLCWFIRRPPPAPSAATVAADPVKNAPVLGLRPGVVFGLLCVAIVGCCVPMSMPMGHLVAFCSDLGFAPARGAEMLSLLLFCAFLSRMFWGALSDRIGGLRTVLLGTICQAVGMALFAVVEDFVGLYILSAAFGLGFGGIVPSYVMAVREHFPAAEAGWRIAMIIFFGLSGMAAGGWVAGVIYDFAAHYQPAFLLGLAFNLVTIAIVASLVMRDRRPSRPVGAVPGAIAFGR
ncbi:MAG: MFS transporter [Alphaproteobacteria bacterium]